MRHCCCVSNAAFYANQRPPSPAPPGHPPTHPLHLELKQLKRLDLMNWQFVPGIPPKRIPGIAIICKCPLCILHPDRSVVTISSIIISDVMSNPILREDDPAPDPETLTRILTNPAT